MPRLNRRGAARGAFQTMISILKFTAAAAVAAAFRSSASAFPYTQPQFGEPVLGDSPTKSKPTNGVPGHGKGVKKQKAKR